MRFHNALKYEIKLLGAVLLVLGAFSCWPTKNGKNLESLTKVIEMEKGPCFGRCPVFKLTIYDNGLASYEGERFTDRLGTYVKNVPSNSYKQLLQSFKEANLWQYKDIYRGRVPDLQTVTIIYHEGAESKSIKGKDGRPTVVMDLEALLDKIANEEGWELKDKPKQDLPANVISNELIVEISNGIDINVWSRKYAKQDMQVVKSLSNNKLFWLVSFNDQIIPPNQMLEFVKNDPDVVSAEFNKKLNKR